MSSNAGVILKRPAHAGASSGGLRPQDFSGRVAAVVAAAGLLLLIGSLIDVGVLWILQRQPSPQWEFAAGTRTIDASTRFASAFGFLYLAAFLSGRSSVTWYRVLGAVLILFATGVAVLGGIVASDYLALNRMVTDQPEAMSLFRSSTIKSVSVAAVAFVLFLTAGIFSVRRPRTGGNP